MDIKSWLEQQQPVYVIDKSIPVSRYVPIDLSPENKELSVGLVSDSDAFSEYIDNYLDKNKAFAAYGGYSEKRQLYKRSELFKEDEDERDIHIGLDIWADADTPVLAALDGKVHSFAYNAGQGNYGPTIILEHLAGSEKFYTLYGHLSVESIEDLEIGDTFKKGQQIATLGDASVNGDYPPHLHFQVILDIEDNFGDYPGVCSQGDLEFYLENCPDPNLLLNLKRPT